MRHQLLLLVFLCLCACARLEPREYATFIATASPSRPAAHFGLPLASGQVVVSEIGGAASLLFSLFADQFQPFVHAGILVIEHGDPYVYEAMGTLWPALGGPPTDAMSGKVRRTSFVRFVQDKRLVGIYDPPPGVDPIKVADFALAHYRNATPFDAYFDFRNHDKLYCTEFVALALAAAGAGPIQLTPLRKNPSLEVALRWLKIEAPEIVLAGSLIAPEQHVGTLSRTYTPAQIRAYFALKCELHRRFTVDQRLGDVFRWTATGLQLRDEVSRFMREGLARFAEVPAADLITATQNLAIEILGPLSLDQPTFAAHVH
jgi:hypothetical protein